jgi:hypothetical protein
MKLDPIAALVCAHEAAHGFAVHHYGGSIERCEIFGSSGEGSTKYAGLSLRARLRVAVAGYIGVRLLLGAAAAVPEDAAGDIEKAVAIAFRFVRVGEAQRLASRGLEEPTEAMFAHYNVRAERLILLAEAEVEALLTANKPALERLAARLREDGTLSHETVAAIVAGGPE